ncbi:MAG: tRNA (adenosine(37)-N6)-threonylcarbamoyltransferase complex dimerization subunit type 1 TsaB [Bacteroidetes bacterium]|nr:tRNA (adenosine(37)-N6)-threonylcarbamoyltransferase complex dimerization subunit type 1 TsaB [Bacteroidota bacterium]
MFKLLLLETATGVCSVALADQGELISLKETSTANSHSSLLTTFIDEILKENDLQYSDLDAIVVSKGPGSYTGLRIGISSAKGLCFSLDKPLIAINTLQSMAYGIHKMIQDENFLICPMIDARRMEVYDSLFDPHLNEIKATAAEIIDENSFSDYFKKSTIYFGGDGADKCREVLSHQKNAKFVSDFKVSAKYMIEIASQKFKEKQFEDVVYFEPYYLKDFIAGKPNVKGLK